jgi:hypothetical protein
MLRRSYKVGMLICARLYGVSRAIIDYGWVFYFVSLRIILRAAAFLSQNKSTNIVCYVAQVY